MSPAKKKPAPKKAPALKAKAPKALAVEPRKKNKGAAILVVLAVVLGLVAQAGWVFVRDRKTQVTLHYDMAIAPRGPGKGQVTGCRHMAADAKGNLYYLQGVNESSTLQKFARDGKWLAWVGAGSPDKDKLYNGWAVAAAADGTAWVAERGTGFVKQYGEDLKLKRSVALAGSDSEGIAVAPDGSVWVSSFSGQLYSLAPGADSFKPFTGSGKGRLIAPYRLCFAPDGAMYVLDFTKGQGQDPSVMCYDAKGGFVRSWVVKDQPVNEFMDIAWHPQGYVVLNDSRPEVVDAKGFRLYTPNGKLAGVATLTDTGQNLRAIPGFAISPNGDWYMDLTPLQQGCGRLSWLQAL